MEKKSAALLTWEELDDAGLRAGRRAIAARNKLRAEQGPETPSVTLDPTIFAGRGLRMARLADDSTPTPDFARELATLAQGEIQHLDVASIEFRVPFQSRTSKASEAYIRRRAAAILARAAQPEPHSPTPGVIVFTLDGQAWAVTPKPVRQAAKPIPRKVSAHPVGTRKG